MSAGWTTTFSRRPSVSTRMWRLRPVTFLPASNPCGSSAEPPFQRQVLRQRLPLAARREHVEDRVQNLADVHLAPTPTAFSRRYRRFDQRPLAVAQIARVAQAVAVGRTAMFRLPHIGTPQPRFGCQRRNHNRFLRFNNFVDRLLDSNFPERLLEVAAR